MVIRRMKELILALALLCSVSASAEEKSKYDNYQEKAESWQKAESVDWPLVSKELGAYLKGVIAEIFFFRSLRSIRCSLLPGPHRDSPKTLVFRYLAR